MKSSRIHTRLDAVGHELVVAVSHGVLVCELSDGTESQEGLETECGGAVSILQRVANQQPVLMVLEEHLLLQEHAPHPIDGSGDEVAIKLTDVLVPHRAEIVALILVQSEIELCTMLNDRDVERRKEHMVLVVDTRYGNNEQSMILARIAVNNG